MSSKKERQLQQRMRRALRTWGGHLFTTVRPDYTDSKSRELVILTEPLFQLQPTTSMRCKPKIREVEYFEIMGDRDEVKSGDVLYMDDTTNMPVVTVLSILELEPMFGFRTNKIGKITNGPDDGNGVIYDNVRFDFISIPTVGEGLDAKVVGSLGIGIRKAVLYARNGIEQGMWLRWNEPAYGGSGTIQNAYRIDVVDRLDPMILLNLSDKKS